MNRLAAELSGRKCLANLHPLPSFSPSLNPKKDDSNSRLIRYRPSRSINFYQILNIKKNHFHAVGWFSLNVCFLFLRMNSWSGWSNTPAQMYCKLLAKCLMQKAVRWRQCRWRWARACSGMYIYRIESRKKPERTLNQSPSIAGSREKCHSVTLVGGIYIYILNIYI